MAIIQDHCLLFKTSPFLQLSMTNLPRFQIHVPATNFSKSNKNPILMQNYSPFSNSLTKGIPHHRKIRHFSEQKDPILMPKQQPLHKILYAHLEFAIAMAVTSIPLPSYGAEAIQDSQKINVESILISIDDFFSRNPFFGPGVAFIWLVVIPLAQDYLKKYKSISAIDVFRKLREMPGAQMLDIRRRQSVEFMASPNLKILGKDVVWVEFNENDEEGFVKQVLGRFSDPANTIICILDNFDGNALKAAELMFKNGFKEAYATKGGLRGKEGWQEIQEKLLPPSVHVYPRKKNNVSMAHLDVYNGGPDKQSKNNGQVVNSPSDSSVNLMKADGNNRSNNAPSAVKHASGRPLSPYPNYPDLRPPSSPMPSKPTS